MCGGRECAKYAECEGYKCTCRQGYSGDGYDKCECKIPNLKTLITFNKQRIQ